MSDVAVQAQTDRVGIIVQWPVLPGVARYRLTQRDVELDRNKQVFSGAGQRCELPFETSVSGRRYAYRLEAIVESSSRVMTVVPFTEPPVSFKPGDVWTLPAIGAPGERLEASNQTVFDANWPGLGTFAGTLKIERIQIPDRAIGFLEHSFRHGDGENGVIVAGDRRGPILYQSRDLGATWTALSLFQHQLSSTIQRHFLTSRGWHIIQTALPAETIVVDASGELVARPEVDGLQWHGTWSIDENAAGTIIFSQYRTGKESIGGILRAYRSVDGGRTWSAALAIPGRLNGETGEIRHFHTCQADPFLPGRWYVSSGDATHECGIWVSDDDGLAWRRVFPKVDRTIDIRTGELQRLMRFTSLTITEDRIVWPTDDNVNGGTAALVWLDKKTWQLSVVDRMTTNLIRNYIPLGNGFSVAISESKQDNSSVTTHLIENHRRVVGACHLRNRTGRKTGFTFSISSARATKGVFFTGQDGAIISESKNGVLRWRFRAWPNAVSAGPAQDAHLRSFAVTSGRQVNWCPKKFEPRPDDLLAFFHAQRTGGMSVRGAIVDAYGRERLMAFRIAPDYKHWAELSDEDLAGYAAYVGHSQFIEMPRARRCLYISVVRHPTERLVSLYRYIRGTESHRLWQLANECEIEAFYRRAVEIDPDYVSNLQTRMVSGSNDIDYALDIVASRYLAVGVNALLDDFVSKLRSTLRWPDDLKLAHRNLAPTPKNFELTSGFEAFAREINESDIRLYDFVCNAWRNQI